MNTTIATGWLVKEASTAYTPSGTKRLVFETIIRQQDGETVPWHCEIADPELMKRAEPLLGPGRPVILQAELCARPYLKHGIASGMIRYLRVIAAEFPDRSGARRQEEEQPEPATT